jgi:type VI secretion system protein ImpK
MNHPSLASTGNPCDDLQPGPAPERSVVAYDELDARLQMRDKRSTVRLFASHNPLVSAASRLLSNIARLKPHETPDQITSLRVRLCKRINQFKHQALQAAVDANTVDRASYVLCSVADEAVLTSAWGIESNWASDSLLHTFHGETSGGITFFQLLEQYMRLAPSHVEILELMYLCLALGFQGRYAATEPGGKELQRLRHDLFQNIQRQRGEVSSNISCVSLPRHQQQRRQVMLIPGWLPVVLTLFSLGLVYSTFAWMLEQEREKVLVPFLQIDALPAAPGID